jgi:cytochrome c oxidase subunit III
MSDTHAHDELGHGNHSPFIQHHFDGPKHQFESGKLGIWLFLTQEILFFSALFVAYIVYRANHPEIFTYAHKYLDTTMGAVNTVVLLCSSLSAAWAVRAAQLNQQRMLIVMLVITILCAFGFLGIKYVEYSHKAHIGTLYGSKFNPTEDPDGDKFTPDQQQEAATVGSGASGEQSVAIGTEEAKEVSGPASSDPAAPPGTTVPGRIDPPPANTSMFFTIYFAMTGLHGIHVVGGIVVFIWLLIRAIKGHFTPEYFGPIDFAALYWHLVDLIWIYLFPLLYLIH